MITARFPLARLRAEHVAGVFDTIHGWNAEIERQRAEGRALIVLDGDVRSAPQVVSDATMHRIYATLRAALNAAVKQRLIPWNPCAGVELPSAERREAEIWGPQEATAFLAATASHRLHIVWRLVLLRGLRRGEVCGLKWDDIDLDSGHLRIRQALLELGGRHRPKGRFRPTTRPARRRAPRIPPCGMSCTEGFRQGQRLRCRGHLRRYRAGFLIPGPSRPNADFPRWLHGTMTK